VTRRSRFFDFTVIIFIFIILFFIIILFSVILPTDNIIDRFLLYGNLIEITSTTLPILVLVIIAIFSIQILYFRDDIHSINLTVKAIGYQ